MSRVATGARPGNAAWWRRRTWLVGILAVLVIGSVAAGVWRWRGGGAAGPDPRLGEPAPRFNLLASTGRVINLDEYLGKQEMTPPCTRS